MDDLKSDAEILVELIEKYHDPKIITPSSPTGMQGVPSSVPLLLRPSSQGIEATSLKKFFDEYRTRPERREGTAILADLRSFIAHANRFKDADSALFANPDKANPWLTSVLDYHKSGAESDPRFGKHRGSYTFPLSDEWKEWNDNDHSKGHSFDVAGFAEFIENRILDVLDPSSAGDGARKFVEAIGCTLATPAKLMELSRGLAVRVDSRVQQTTVLATGEAQFQFAATHNDETGAPLKVPGAFLIAVPVFRGGDLYQLPVRLRYRVSGGGVTWFYDLARVDEIFEHAFTEACDTAANETQLPLFLGKPE